MGIRGAEMRSLRLTTVLRALAIAIAVAGVVDPAFTVSRSRPPRVEVRIAGPTPGADAAAIRDRILDAVRPPGDAPAPAGTAAPDAVIVIGESERVDALLDAEQLPAQIPISIVDTRPRSGVWFASVMPPDAVLPRGAANIQVIVERDLPSGSTTTVALEEEGVDVAQTAVTWTGGHERRSLSLRYLPSSPGLHRVRVVARSAAGTTPLDAADVPVLVENRQLRVVTYEPRPSWGLTFVRRALEADPVFAMASLVRASKGIDVRAGAPVDRVATASLAPHAAVIVGAPEALTQAEVAALEGFARQHGGVVVFVPDRRPSGPYVRLLGAGRFDEVLLETAAAINPVGAASRPRLIEAAELAIPQDLAPGTAVLATTGPSARPVIVSWPAGAGRIIFSGALDAWRYRGDEGAAFARFWNGSLRAAAAESPRPLELSVVPSLAAPGDRVSVRASFRPSELAAQGQETRIPAIQGSVIAESGATQPVRLWPAAEAGVFEGMFTAETTGRFDVRVEAESIVADAPLLVQPDVVTLGQRARERVHLVAGASGGVVVYASDLSPLIESLKALEREDRPVRERPMRSAWWMLVFAASVAGEWALRRRRGLR
jgi:hypothetical protein